MLPIRYGSFLEERERSRARYELFKPALSVSLAGLLAFSAACFSSLAAACVWAGASAPDPAPDVEFQKAQALVRSVNASVAAAQKARPFGIDACGVVSAVGRAAAASNDVAVTGIRIEPEKYVIKAEGRDSAAADAFMKQINIAVPCEKEVSDVKASPNPSPGRSAAFTVTITPKAAKQPVHKQAAGKPAGKGAPK